MTDMAQRDLRRVRARARQLGKAKDELADAILRANESGESVRDIAPYAGRSPARTHDLLKEAQGRRGLG